MGVKDRINILNGFKKVALNFKSFERYWDIVLNKANLTPQELNKYKSMDVKVAFEEYQRGLLLDKLQNIIEKHDRETSPFISPNINLPKGERAARERESAETMMSGRHSPDAYIPTKQIGVDIKGNPIQTLEDLETVKETGDLPFGESGAWKESKTTWAPYLLVYKGSQGLISRRYEDPNEARWVSSHPEVASGYAKRGREGILEIYDLRKIPEDQRSVYSRNITKDIRGRSPEEVLLMIHNVNSLFGKSPFYEMTISDEALHKARIAKYKSLPGIGWMLVEGRNILKDGLTEAEAREHFNLLSRDALRIAREKSPLFFYYNFHKFVDLNKDILNYLAKGDPKSYLKEGLDKKAVEKGLEYINKIAIQSLAKKDPDFYFSSGYDKKSKELGLDNLNSVALNSLARSNFQKYFDEGYDKKALEMGLGESNSEAFRAAAEKNALLYFQSGLSTRAKDLGFNDINEKVLNNLIDKDPFDYFEKGYQNFATTLGLNSLNKVALETIGEESPGDYFRDGFNQKADELGFGDINIKILTQAAKNNTHHYFYYNLESFAESLGLDKEHLTGNALKQVAENNPRYYFEENLDQKAESLGLNDINASALQNFARKDSDNYLYKNSDKKFDEMAKSLGLNPGDLYYVALKDLAEQDPRYYFEEGLDQKALELGFIDINRIAAEKARSMNLTIPNLDKYSGTEIKLMKLASALESLGMKKESGRILLLIDPLIP